MVGNPSIGQKHSQVARRKLRRGWSGQHPRAGNRRGIVSGEKPNSPSRVVEGSPGGVPVLPGSPPFSPPTRGASGLAPVRSTREASVNLSDRLQEQFFDLSLALDQASHQDLAKFANEHGASDE